MISELFETNQSTWTVIASPQLTISWSQGQSTLDCNLATQVPNARVTILSVTYEITNKQRLIEVKNWKLGSNVCKHFKGKKIVVKRNFYKQQPACNA